MECSPPSKLTQPQFTALEFKIQHNSNAPMFFYIVGQQKTACCAKTFSNIPQTGA